MVAEADRVGVQPRFGSLIIPRGRTDAVGHVLRRVQPPFGGFGRGPLFREELCSGVISLSAADYMERIYNDPVARRRSEYTRFIISLLSIILASFFLPLIWTPSITRGDLL